MLLLALGCVCLLSCLIWRRRDRIKRPPELSGKIPLIGHAHHFLKDSVATWTLVKRISTESLNVGGVLTFSLGTRIIYAITDPDDCFKVSNECLEKGFIYDFTKPWLGEGILTANVPVWKRHRKLLNSAFSQEILEGFVGIFNNQGKRLAEHFGTKVGKGSFDHAPLLSLNNLETICKSAMGVDAKEHGSLMPDYIHALEKMLSILLERFQKVWMHTPFIYEWTKLKKEEDAALEILHRLSNEVLQKRKSQLKDEINASASRDTFRPFIDLIIKMKRDEIYTDKQIRDEVDTIIFGGHDTVALALVFALVLIGSHKDVQEKLYQETRHALIEYATRSSEDLDCLDFADIPRLQEILGTTDRDITKNDLSKLVYMNAVLKETLRVYTIGPVVARYASNEVQLKNYVIPAGSSCFLFLCGLHQHPTWGPDGDKFEPERWLDPSRLPKNPNTFGGFSVGRRACIGRVYAMMSMKITLAHILRQYRVFADCTQMTLKMETFLKPHSGHHISVEPRI